MATTNKLAHVTAQHLGAYRRGQISDADLMDLVEGLAAGRDQLEVQVERLRGALVAIVGELESEHTVVNIDSALEIVVETPAQSVAHIEAAALRGYVDARIEQIDLTHARSYALAHYSIDLRDLLTEANRIEQAAKS